MLLLSSEAEDGDETVTGNTIFLCPKVVKSLKGCYLVTVTSLIVSFIQEIM